MADLALREFAERSLKGALLALWHTFNIGNSPDVPYSFDPATRKEAEEHMRALTGLLIRGKLTPKLGARAQGNGDYQRFMQKATEARHG
jgi:hypothetical protein